MTFSTQCKKPQFPNFKTSKANFFWSPVRLKVVFFAPGSSPKTNASGSNGRINGLRKFVASGRQPDGWIYGWIWPMMRPHD